MICYICYLSERRHEGECAEYHLSGLPPSPNPHGGPARPQGEGEATRHNVVMSAGISVAVPTPDPSVICYLLSAICVTHSRVPLGAGRRSPHTTTTCLRTHQVVESAPTPVPVLYGFRGGRRAMSSIWCDAVSPTDAVIQPSTRFMNWHEPQQFDRSAISPTHNVTINDAALAASAYVNTAVAQWQPRHSDMHIVVLGTSVSVGCGSRAPALTCDPSMSWARHAGQWLDGLMSGSGLRTHLHLFGKNSVTPTYFLQCLDSKVRRDTALVLLELQPVVSELTVQEVDAVAAALRRVAPRAVIAFVGWPTSQQARNTTRLDDALNASAARSGFDALLISHLMATGGYRGHLKAYYGDHVHPNSRGHGLMGEVRLWLRACLPAILAALPYSTGHTPALLACTADETAKDVLIDIALAASVRACTHTQAVARFIAWRLRAAVCSSQSTAREVTRGTSRAWGTLMSTEEGAGTDSSADADDDQSPTARRFTEQCLDATALVNSSCTISSTISNWGGKGVCAAVSGWTLVDEGGAKGVHKRGLVSARVGDILRIGPIASDVRCGLLSAQLGFLQSWRPEQGALRISCVGCKCHGLPGFWNSRAYPFPLVQTSTRREGRTNAQLPTPGAGCEPYASSTSRDATKSRCELQNASVTATTRFWIALEDAKKKPSALSPAPPSRSECYIHVAHWGYPDTITPSRVRVDSLSLAQVDCLELCPLCASQYLATLNHTILPLLERCARSRSNTTDGHHVVPQCSRAVCSESALRRAPVLDQSVVV